MTFADFLIGAAVLFIFLLICVIFLMPTDVKRQRKKRKLEGLSQEQKDWKNVSLKLENLVSKLRAEIEESQRQQVEFEKRILIEQEKYKKLHEKLSQERKWQQKEFEKTDKFGDEIKGLKQEIISAQESFASERSSTLKLKHKLDEIEKELREVNDRRREAEAENASFKTKNDDYKIQIASLTKENAELKKKHDNLEWVAKSEYDRVVKEFKEKQKEFERLYRDLKGKV